MSREAGQQVGARAPRPHHVLKCWPEYFEAVASGAKTFEVRKHDRPFAVGDHIRLREWDPRTAHYTEREADFDVTYILDAQAAEWIEPGILRADYCVLAIRLRDDELAALRAENAELHGDLDAAILESREWQRRAEALKAENARLTTLYNDDVAKMQATHDVLAEGNARLRAFVEAATRYGRVIREWDADRNLMPLPPACAEGRCGFPPDSSGSPCGDAQHPGNEWDHAEAHFIDALDALDPAPAAPPAES